MILLPKHRDIYIEPPTARLRGKFKLRVLNLNGKVIRELPEFTNLITNAGLDGIFNGTPSGFAYIFAACYVGTGNTTPAYTDTTLTTFLAQTNQLGNSPMGSWVYVAAAGSVPPYWTSSGVWTFGVGVATGTISEIGIGNGNFTPPSTGSYTLFSHALIVDGSGNPTTITVLSNEQLQVTYTLELFWNTTTQTGSLSFGGTTYNLSWLPYNIPTTFGVPSYKISSAGGNPYITYLYAYNGTLGTPTTLPTGTSTYINFASAGSVSWATYTVGNYYNDYTMTIPIGYLNLSGGITVLAFQSLYHSFQIGWSPAIPKTSSYSLTFVNRFAWARYP